MVFLVTLLVTERDIVIHLHNTLIIDHYPVALDCANARGTDTYISLFQKCLMLLIAQLLTKGPIISDQTLGPFWDLGIKVSKPTPVFVDNMSVVLNAMDPGITLNNKTIALSYHYGRENVANNVVGKK